MKYSYKLIFESEHSSFEGILFVSVWWNDFLLNNRKILSGEELLNQESQPWIKILETHIRLF